MSKNRKVGRAKTRDVAFTYRMGAGFPGDVNRTHPASIEPAINEATGSNPLTLFGQAAMVDGVNNAVRAVNNASDSALGNTTATIWGVVVRPFPFQQTGASGVAYGAEGFGTGGPGVSQAVDILKQGYIMVQNNVPTAAVTQPSKGGVVYVRVVTGASTFSALPIGGFESTLDTGAATNQFKVGNAVWNGPADASNVAELIVKD